MARRGAFHGENLWSDEYRSAGSEWRRPEVPRYSLRLVAALGVSAAMHLGAVAFLARHIGWLSGGEAMGYPPTIEGLGRRLDVKLERPGLPTESANDAPRSGLAAVNGDTGSKREPRRQTVEPLLSEWRWFGLPSQLSPMDYLDRPSVDRAARPINSVVVLPPEDFGAGKVMVELLVSADGRVNGARLEYSDLPAPFVEAVLRSFRDTRFSPAVKQGKPVPMRYRLQASFGYAVMGEGERRSLDPSDVGTNSR